MAERKSGQERNRNLCADLLEDGFKAERRLCSVFGTAVGELACQECPCIVQDRGVTELRQHPVDPVWFLADILQEEYGVGKRRLMDSPQDGDEVSKVPPEQTARGFSLPYGNGRLFGRNDLAGFFRGCEESPENLLRQAVQRICQIHSHHRSLKRHQPAFFPEGKLEGRDVAVSHEDFGMTRDTAIVDQGEQPWRAIPAADAHDGFDVLVGEHLVEIGHALLVSAGKIAVGLQNMSSENGAVPHPFKIGDTFFNA